VLRVLATYRQQAMERGVGQNGFDIDADRAVRVEGDGGVVVGAELDFTFAVQGQGAAGPAE
jgi:hypothetical protein